MALRVQLSGVLLAATLCAQAGYAASTCAPTAATPVKNYPSAAKIPTSNNLLLPAGKAVEAEGQKLILTGRVLDSQCMPVPDAVVELWQNNPFGKWLLAEPRDAATPNPTFAGAGRTYTNSNGEFTFITAFPAPLGKRAPYVSIKVARDGMKGLSTALFFAADARNTTDDVYKKLSPKAREDVTIAMHADEDRSGDLVGSITLVLGGKAPFRTY